MLCQTISQNFNVELSVVCLKRVESQLIMHLRYAALGGKNKNLSPFFPLSILNKNKIKLYFLPINYLLNLGNKIPFINGSTS